MTIGFGVDQYNMWSDYNILSVREGRQPRMIRNNFIQYILYVHHKYLVIASVGSNVLHKYVILFAIMK